MQRPPNHKGLARELRGRVEDIRRATAKIRAILDDPRWRQPEEEWIGADLLARRVHDFFNAVEDAAYRVSNDINGEVPAGPSGHKDLIARVLAEVPGKRRPLFSAELTSELDEILRFRHFFRHAYGAELDPGKVREQADRVLRIAPKIEQNLAEFADWLDSGDPP